MESWKSGKNDRNARSIKSVKSGNRGQFARTMSSAALQGIIAIGALSSTGALAQITEIVSISSTGQQGNDISGRFSGPVVSNNGRIVAFDSMASTLVPGDTNLRVDVFVRDRGTGVTERASVSTGGAQGNGTSTRPALDGSGNLVFYDSDATNLVSGDTNSSMDVFLYNRTTHSTERVSVSSSEIQGNGPSWGPTVSADGRFVCFVSLASNLVPGDTNSVEDIFVRDLVAGTTERVNLGDAGQQSNSSTTLASISANGRWVAFSSFASNLVPNDTNDWFDVFIHDRVTGRTERASISSAGVEADGSSSGPAVDDEGRFVVFWSDATNLVTDDTNERKDVFVRDRLTELTERVSVSSSGAQGDGNSPDPAVRGQIVSGPRITPDGRYVAFFSSSANLVPGDTNVCPPVFQSPPGRCPDAFVRDLVTGTTTRVNVAADGTQANDRTADPAISPSGRAIVFFSAAGNLVANDTNSCPPVFPNSCPDIFIHELVDPAAAGDVSSFGSLALVARPNPTGDAVELTLRGADPSGVSLVVYDVAGRPVRTLAAGSLAAGPPAAGDVGAGTLAGTTLTWDGRDDRGRRVDSGTYFCKVANGARVTTAKITWIAR